jgi:hypothetical protein
MPFDRLIDDGQTERVAIDLARENARARRRDLAGEPQGCRTLLILKRGSVQNRQCLGDSAQGPHRLSLQ